MNYIHTIDYAYQLCPSQLYEFGPDRTQAQKDRWVADFLFNCKHWDAAEQQLHRINDGVTT